MGTELASGDRILPDVRRPESLIRLPRWAQERAAILKKEHQRDSKGMYREVPVLPASLILSRAQLAEAKRAIETLDMAVGMTPVADLAHAEATTVAITKMTMALPGRETGDLAGEARGEAYMAALEDVPFWALREGIRRWYRGDCGSGHDYRWLPAPAVLRQIAMTEVYRVLGVRRILATLVEAVPAVQRTEAEEARMRERITEHLRLKRA